MRGWRRVWALGAVYVFDGRPLELKKAMLSMLTDRDEQSLKAAQVR